MTRPLQGAGRSDVGRRREFNEDAYAIDLESGLFALADGMGGHAAGEVAAHLAIETLSGFIRQTASSTEITWPQGFDERLTLAANRLRAAIRLANERIFRSIEEHEERRGMGTTIVAALGANGNIAIAHVGDSRAYLLHEGTLSQLTNDHSWVNEQVHLGLLSREDALRHPFRNVITRALGSREDVVADITELPLDPGDRVLLCSDGLTTMVSDADIQAVLEAHPTDPAAAAAHLVDQANRAGGEDNITVIVCSPAP